MQQWFCSGSSTWFVSRPLRLRTVKINVSKSFLGDSLTIDKLLGDHLHLHQVQEGSCRTRNPPGHPTTQGFLATSYGMVCLYGHVHHVLCRWLQRLCTRKLGCSYIPFLVSLLMHPVPTAPRKRKGKGGKANFKGQNRYLMIFLFPVLFVSWKLIHKTKWRAPEEVDLFSDKADIDEYERQFVPAPPRYAVIRP